MKLYFDDSEFDAQLQRTAVKAPYRMSDLGEIIACASRIEPGNYDSWYDEWRSLAQDVAGRAESFAARGHHADACGAYLRACEYHRSAFFFCRHDIDAEPLHRAFDDQRDCFAAAVAHTPGPVERVEIDLDGVHMPAYFFGVDGSGAPRPALVYPCGYDSTVEEGYGWGVAEPLPRGFNCLIFAGPGQGEDLYEQKVPFRHDFETVLAPVVDYLVDRDDVDATRIAIMGRSFGGYHAPRGASGEDRIAALIADPAQIDMGANLAARLPQVNALGVENKVFHQFTAAEGSGGHCEGLGTTRFNETALGWLRETFQM